MPGAYVIGTHLDGRIFKRHSIPAVKCWDSLHVPDRTDLLQVDCADNDTVVGVNRAGNIYRWKSGWEQLAGKATWASIGSDGSIWVTTATKEILLWHESSRSWEKMPGSATQISVADAENVWSITDKGDVAQWLPASKSWDVLKGRHTFTRVAVGPGSRRVVALTDEGHVYAYRQATEEWLTLYSRDDVVKEISVSDDYIVMTTAEERFLGIHTRMQCIDAEENPGKYKTRMFREIWFLHVPSPDAWVEVALQGKWQKLDGKLATITVHDDHGGHIAGCNDAHELYQRHGVDKPWEKLPVPFRQLDFGATGRSVGVHPVTQEVHTWTGSTWRILAGVKAVWASMGVDASIWAVNTAQEVVRWEDDKSKWEAVPGTRAIQISVGDRDNVFAINDKDEIIQYVPSTGKWKVRCSDFCRVAVSAGGKHAVAVDREDKIYAFHTISGNWTRIPGSLREIDVCDGFIVGTNLHRDIYVLRL